MRDTLECVTQYVEAFGTKDFSKVPFDANVTFQGPLLDHPLKGKEAVIEFLTQVTRPMTDLRVKQHIVQGEHACAVIQFRARGMAIEACDYFRVSDNGITEIRVFLGTVPYLFPLLRTGLHLRRMFTRV